MSPSGIVGAASSGAAIPSVALSHLHGAVAVHGYLLCRSLASLPIGRQRNPKRPPLAVKPSPHRGPCRA
jgi:hypothetical protein